MTCQHPEEKEESSKRAAEPQRQPHRPPEGPAPGRSAPQPKVTLGKRQRRQRGAPRVTGGEGSIVFAGSTLGKTSTARIVRRKKKNPQNPAGCSRKTRNYRPGEPEGFPRALPAAGDLEVDKKLFISRSPVPASGARSGEPGFGQRGGRAPGRVPNPAPAATPPPAASPSRGTRPSVPKADAAASAKRLIL